VRRLDLCSLGVGADLSLFVLPSRKGSNEQWILTKGDNNHADDVGLYNGMRYLKRSNIVGKVQG
jgi:signal peptidase I